jgi:hypothetical protein
VALSFFLEKFSTLAPSITTNNSPMDYISDNMFEELQYTVLLAEGTYTKKIEKLSAARLFNSGKTQGDDLEFIYSLQLHFEQVMHMHVGDSFAFSSNRDTKEWTSVIVRTK